MHVSPCKLSSRMVCFIHIEGEQIFNEVEQQQFGEGKCSLTMFFAYATLIHFIFMHVSNLTNPKDYLYFFIIPYT